MGDYEKHLPNATRLYRARYISGDYAKIAEGLGAYSERVERPDEIIPAAKRALRATQDGRPALLDVVTREITALSKYW